jgi:hypothetical protein
MTVGDYKKGGRSILRAWIFGTCDNRTLLP